jgi:hypothetical protein
MGDQSKALFTIVRRIKNRKQLPSMAAAFCWLCPFRTIYEIVLYLKVYPH